MQVYNMSGCKSITSGTAGANELTSLGDQKGSATTAISQWKRMSWPCLQVDAASTMACIYILCYGASYVGTPTEPAATIGVAIAVCTCCICMGECQWVVIQIKVPDKKGSKASSHRKSILIEGNMMVYRGNFTQFTRYVDKLNPPSWYNLTGKWKVGN